VTFPALLASEVRRLASRRVVRLGFAIALGIVVVVLVVTAARSTGTGPTDHTLYLRRLWLERSGRVVDNTVLATSVYLFILVVGIAATAVGADYRAGTMGTLLTWEPRRVRVAVARLLAIAIVSVALYLVVTGVFIAGWALGAELRGSTAGLGPDFWTDLAAVVGRSAVGVVVLALLTAGLAFVTRSTVGAVIVWFGYLIGVEAVLAQRVQELQPGILIANLAAFLQGEDVMTSRVESVGPTGIFRVERLLAQPGPGLVRALLITIVVATLGVLAFRRRDVG
jgi:ABC-2 type transport system permease protein